MGNQGYSNEGTRQCAEIVWNGDIGNVTEVHAWSDRPIWPQGLTEIPKADPIPPTLDWDLWLGIAEKRPFTAGGKTEPDRNGGFFYQPFNWRGFYDFGCGALGDMACHILGAPNMALHLSQRKILGVECIKKEGVSSFMFPKISVIRYDFAPYGDMPALKIFWYDGLKQESKYPRRSGRRVDRRYAVSAASRRPARSGRRRARRDLRRRRDGAPADGGMGMGMPPASNDFHSPGRVFHWDEFEALKHATDAAPFPHSRWQPLHRRQGHADHRHLRRGDAADSGREDEGLPHAASVC